MQLPRSFYFSKQQWAGTQQRSTMARAARTVQAHGQALVRAQPHQLARSVAAHRRPGRLRRRHVRVRGAARRAAVTAPPTHPVAAGGGRVGERASRATAALRQATHRGGQCRGERLDVAGPHDCLERGRPGVVLDELAAPAVPRRALQVERAHAAAACVHVPDLRGAPAPPSAARGTFATARVPPQPARGSAARLRQRALSGHECVARAWRALAPAWPLAGPLLRA